MRLEEELRGLSARHPCPEGHTPVKSELGRLIDRYGVGNIPPSELHRANTITPAELERLKLKQAAEARESSARLARTERIDRMADEWAATHGR